MTRVKICGLTHLSHAIAAAEARADYVGMVFSQPSTRQISPEKGLEISSGLREFCAPGGSRPQLVGVFVNETPDFINTVADRCGLDLVQLSGDEDPSICRRLERPLIKAIRVAPDESRWNASRRMLAWLGELSGESLLLLEGKVEGRYGGTGRLADWALAGELAKEFRFLLAGGLNPDNVADAVRAVRPWGVDVSSGVETAGVKDPAKIRSFVLRARGLDPSMPNGGTSGTAGHLKMPPG